MPQQRFAIQTFDAFEVHIPRQPFEVPSSGRAFPIYDPFGLRKAVLPVFRRNPDGSAQGMGTAFHVDGWGRLLTADHVVDFIREHLPKRSLHPGSLHEIDLAKTPHATVLLSIGVVFGTITIPDNAFAPIGAIHTVTTERDDPLARLRGESTFHVAADLAGMQAIIQPDAPKASTVPVQLRNWQPTIGEQVFAVGYPELAFKSLDSNQLREYLEEGMFGAYGQITDVYPNGRGSSNPTPVFQVDGDWRSGMSGGPVFNKDGQVVGIVSRSLEPDGEASGVGYATCLSWIPEASKLTPSLDPDNPGWRFGYGVFRLEPWHLAGVFRAHSEAEKLLRSLDSTYQVAYGSHRIGSDDFVCDRC